MATIALGIPTTPWVPARAASMAHLCRLLGVDGHIGPEHRREFTDRTPNWQWSADLWHWGLETGADFLLQIQDDVTVAPNFWPALRAMLEAVPDQVIGLHACHPAGPKLALEGHRWYATADGLVGPAYVFPRQALADFLYWKIHGMRRGWEARGTEDSLIDVWAMATGRRIWHPIPTLTQHEVEIESTYGNDAHPYRAASVTWVDGDVLGFSAADLERPEFWDPHVARNALAYLGRFYTGVHHLCRRWVKHWTEEMHEVAERDACPEALRGWLR